VSRVGQKRSAVLNGRAAIAAVCVVLASGAALASPADRDALRKAVDQLLSQPPLSSAHVSVEIASLEDGRAIYSRSADDALNPASNTKLVTAATALLRLGPEFRFTTEYFSERPLQRGRAGTLYVRGRADPTLNTERLAAQAADLWHRGVRQVKDVVLDDSYFDAEAWGPGWEQEASDKAYAAPVGALSLNHNVVAIYVTPGARVGAPARVELEPEVAEYFHLAAHIVTVRMNGRKKLRPHTFAEPEGTRVTVDGRVPLKAEPVVMYRRVTDPTFYFGKSLKALLRQRGIRVTGKVKRGPVPQDAPLLASFDSQELADVVRDMNKASSNFIAEMLLKTLGAEMKGAPGTWPKGVSVAEDLLAELGVAKGSYQLRNGSGLNDTNRFSAHQMTTLLVAVWRRFPVAADFVSSLGIAARDGTLRQRMEGTDAAGRLRAKTGTLDKVTALSGFVQSVGGERFAFSILVNDWPGRSSPVVASVDRLGGIISSAGVPDLPALANLGAPELQPAELKARVATYASMWAHPDKKNLPPLRTALRTERDPLVRVTVAEALYRADPDQGGGALLEALPAGTDVFVRLHSVCRELSLPVPAVSSLLDLAVDGNAEALLRLLALAPLARGEQRDVELEAALADGLDEVADASPEELATALRTAPPAQAQALLEVLAAAFAQEGTDPGRTPLARLLRNAQAADAEQARGWLAVLEQRPASAARAAQESPAPAATAAILEAAAAAKAAATAAPSTTPAAFAPADAATGTPAWPATTIPNPGWLRRGTTKTAQPCTADNSHCVPDPHSGG
jgi:serine-type D-Ala-D-Ala carboxypeptidase/endopeptidase (penicillin-binding protein 4)